MVGRFSGRRKRHFRGLHNFGGTDRDQRLRFRGKIQTTWYQRIGNVSWPKGSAVTERGFGDA